MLLVLVCLARGKTMLVLKLLKVPMFCLACPGCRGALMVVVMFFSVSIYLNRRLFHHLLWYLQLCGLLDLVINRSQYSKNHEVFARIYNKGAKVFLISSPVCISIDVSHYAVYVELTD